MNQVKVIAVDTGNKNIKTPNFVFPAGLIESSHLPCIGGSTLIYKDKEYAIVDRRLPQKNNKCGDDSYFLLCLAAIGKELEYNSEAFTPPHQDDCVDVVLLAGLPPLHCREIGGRFADYFKNREDPICFTLNGKNFQIRMIDVHIYPQGYSAAITVLEEFKFVREVNLIDIGGFTVDILRLINFKPDMSVCTCLYFGANRLFERINERMRAKGLNNIADSVIEGILLGDEKVLIDSSPERVELIKSNAASFTRELMSEISQCGLDLTESTTVFIGGGSILLKEYIEKAKPDIKPYFVNDVQANAKGYRLLYENRNAGRV